MISRYKTRFEQLQKQKQKAFIPYMMLGWPNPEKSLATIEQMIKSGVSALELGFAFSDPVADGPIIQKASYETIATGFSVADAFDLIAKVRKLDQEIPIGILTYFNTVLSQGIHNFFDMAKISGVDGVLIADLPAENAVEVQPAAQAAGVDLIFLLSPLTSANRIDTILANANGFLYLVSRLGVTGVVERSKSDDLSLKQLIEKVKSKTSLPIYAGFGISNSHDAQAMFDIGVDGVIVGSRVIELSRDNNSSALLDKFYAEMIGVCAKQQHSKVSA